MLIKDICTEFVFIYLTLGPTVPSASLLFTLRSKRPHLAQENECQIALLKFIFKIELVIHSPIQKGRHISRGPPQLISLWRDGLKYEA